MNTNETAVSLLRPAPYFGGLGPKVLATIAARCQSKSFRAGQLVFMEGDPCRHLHLLESGRVKFFRTSAEGREQILRAFERPGDTFCIPSAFHTGRHIVSGGAVVETRLHLLDMDTVSRLAQEHPSIAIKLVATAGEHMAHLVSLAEDLSLKSATARLARYLASFYDDLLQKPRRPADPRSAGRAARFQRAVARQGDAEGGLEHPGEMGLVGEAGGQRHIGQRSLPV